MDPATSLMDLINRAWPYILSIGACAAAVIRTSKDYLELSKLRTENAQRVKESAESAQGLIQVATLDEVRMYGRNRVALPNDKARRNRATQFMQRFLEDPPSKQKAAKAMDEFSPGYVIPDRTETAFQRHVNELLSNWQWDQILHGAATLLLLCFILIVALDFFSDTLGERNEALILVLAAAIVIGISISKKLKQHARSLLIERLDLEEDIYWTNWWRSMYWEAYQKRENVREPATLAAEYDKLRHERDETLRAAQLPLTVGRYPGR